jgi:ribosome-binding protein aMBF1 (putative translation factor)
LKAFEWARPVGQSRQSIRPVPVAQPRAEKPSKIVAASNDLGGAIRAARTAAGLSQADLAAKLKTNQANVARLENGRSPPSTTTLQHVAQATGHKLMISFIR